MKTMTIYELLKWAYTVELPKAGRPGADMVGGYGMSWSGIQAMGELGTIIDRTPNAYGVIPEFFSGDEPHADAIRVGEAVEALRSTCFDIPHGWNPFPLWDDEHGLIAQAVAAVVERIRLKPDVLAGHHVANMVITYALLGRGPDWRADQPEIQMVSKGGKPAWFVKRVMEDCFGRKFEVETDGYDRKRQKPVAGAYRKHELVTPVSSAALSRLDWQLWQDALSLISGRLAGVLQTVCIVPFREDRQPWAREDASISGKALETHE